MKFTEEDFFSSEYKTTKEKADLANKIVRFIEDDFPVGSFTKPMYTWLSGKFGFIAHYNLQGFLGTYFVSGSGKLKFLQQIANCWYVSEDRPDIDGDVEYAIQKWVKESRIIQLVQSKNDDAAREAELSQLNYLAKKYPATAADIVSGI